MRAAYGCIGRTLKHSFSAEIHTALREEPYELVELAPEDVAPFMERAAFSAINVTIPYKETVLPFLFSVDRHAESIGAVNTVVKRDGRLYGYNTDYYGMCALLEHAGISVRGAKVAILGTGGTSKTALAVTRDLGAACIVRVSRDGKEGAITYEELYERHTDIEILVQTTPVGMYPGLFDCPINIDRFPHLVGVIDAIYNPLRTPLVLAARERGIAAEGGLYMLVAQAVRASELFHGVTYPTDTVERIFRRIRAEKENVVLIGMPASGKSTVGRTLARLLGRPLMDTDPLVEQTLGRSIAEIFRTDGEEAFREAESAAVREVAACVGAVVATGGGAILREENVRALRENGRLFFLDRPLDELLPTPNRPTAATAEAILARYLERYERYLSCADIRVPIDAPPSVIAERIKGDLYV